MIQVAHINQLPEAHVRALTQQLLSSLNMQSVQLRDREAAIDTLTHEMAVLKRLTFAGQSEASSFTQIGLLEETIDENMEALSHEFEGEQPAETPQPQLRQPKR